MEKWKTRGIKRNPEIDSCTHGREASEKWAFKTREERMASGLTWAGTTRFPLKVQSYDQVMTTLHSKWKHISRWIKDLNVKTKQLELIRRIKVIYVILGLGKKVRTSKGKHWQVELYAILFYVFFFLGLHGQGAQLGVCLSLWHPYH